MVALTQPGLRGSLWSIAKSSMHPAVLGPTTALLGWTVGLASLAHVGGLWESDLRADTGYWFITVGLGLLASFKEHSDPAFLRHTIRRAVGLTALMEGFANLEVFGLVAEIFLPFMVLLGGTLAVSESDQGGTPVHALITKVLSLVGLSVLVYVGIRLAADFDAGHTARALALPVWLTFGSLPFTYAFALVVEYQAAFDRIDSRTDDVAQRRRAKRALLRAANVRLAELAGFSGHWIWDLASTESDADARVVAQRWRQIWRAEQHAQRMRDARAYMETWLTLTDATLADIHTSSLRRAWERLDGGQRETLKAEGVRLARNATEVEALRRLPD